MALVREYGKPTFFVTITCNIHWPGIQSQLEGQQTPYDRPYVVCRVFHEKLKMIIKDFENGVFGEMNVSVKAIEFQKRGTPHAHCLFWIKDFIESPQTIDNILCAELPPPHTTLHRIVLEKMVHGPCGSINPGLACMASGKCRYSYPKQFSQTTIIGDDSFPTYHRRSLEDGGVTAKKTIRGGHGILIDNGSIVPYFPYLTKKYDCHINGEYCATIKSMKYLFKYQLKGADLISLRMFNEEDEHVDEIEVFQTHRYVSSCEAYWRIAEYDIVKLKPPVIQLQIHLENEQIVVYDSNMESAQRALVLSTDTQLTAYFAANEMYEEARSIKYEEFPQKITYHKTEKKWTQRLKGFQIGRMIRIHPNQEEKFYLPDNQWHECLQEATRMASPFAIRILFCNILLNCYPSRPELLFRTFEASMKEDFLRIRRGFVNLTEDETVRAATNDLLCSIDTQLKEGNKCNGDFHIPPANYEEMMNDNLNDGEVDPDARHYYNGYVDILNEGQRAIFDTLRGTIDNNGDGFFHIDAPGGTGKTFVCNVILAYARQYRKIAIATTMSGIAATLLTLGTTAHKRFGFPIPHGKESSNSIKLNSKKADIISQVSIIFIDEVSMMHYFDLDCLDRFLREKMENDSPMGGKLVVLMGDFRQILPVVPHGSRADIVSATVKNSQLWRQVQVLRLTENMRVTKISAIDPSQERTQKLKQYAQWLLDLGEGRAHVLCDNNIIKVPEHMVCKTPKIMRQSVFNDFLEHYQSTEYLSKSAIMASTNKVVQDGNCKMVDSLPGDLIISSSIDKCVEKADEASYDTDFLNMMNPSGLPPHRLALKNML